MVEQEGKAKVAFLVALAKATIQENLGWSVKSPGIVVARLSRQHTVEVERADDALSEGAKTFPDYAVRLLAEDVVVATIARAELRHWQIEKQWNAEIDRASWPMDVALPDAFTTDSPYREFVALWNLVSADAQRAKGHLRTATTALTKL